MKHEEKSLSLSRYPPGYTETRAMARTRPLRSPAALQCCAAGARFGPSRFSWRFRTRLRNLRPAPLPHGQSGTPASPGTCLRRSGRGLPAEPSSACRHRGQRSTNDRPQGRDERGSSLALSERVTRVYRELCERKENKPAKYHKAVCPFLIFFF